MLMLRGKVGIQFTPFVAFNAVLMVRYRSSGVAFDVSQHCRCRVV